MSMGAVSAPITPKDGKMALDKIAIGGSLVSIVIPCCGMMEYTEHCLPSIIKHTRTPYELIFIDVGSLDGTKEFLKGLAIGLRQVRIEIVRTPTDLGIGQACRQALEKCQGAYIVLLNNDTIVTKGWIQRLTGLLSTPGCGMVGPMSNYAAPPQLVETVPYRSGLRKSSRAGDDASGPNALIDVEAVHSFADKFHEDNLGKWLNSERLGGFCLMLERELYKKLDRQGDLNKHSDLSLFDTDVLSSQVRRAGFNLGICRDLFIHHFGTRTFAHGAPAAAGGSMATLH
jgi:O-antigen biosynthesis protein